MFVVFDYARRKTVGVAPSAITCRVNSLTVTADYSRLVYTPTQNPMLEIDLTLIQFWPAPLNKYSGL